MKCFCKDILPYILLKELMLKSLFDTLDLYKQGLMSVQKLQSMKTTTTKPIGSTYHDLSLKFYWVFSLGQGGTCPGMLDRGYVTAIFRTKKKNKIEG